MVGREGDDLAAGPFQAPCKLLDQKHCGREVGRPMRVHLLRCGRLDSGRNATGVYEDQGIERPDAVRGHRTAASAPTSRKGLRAGWRTEYGRCRPPLRLDLRRGDGCPGSNRRRQGRERWRRRSRWATDAGDQGGRHIRNRTCSDGRPCGRVPITRSGDESPPASPWSPAPGEETQS